MPVTIEVEKDRSFLECIKKGRGVRAFY